jgi:hypothetical protein
MARFETTSEQLVWGAIEGYYETLEDELGYPPEVSSVPEELARTVLRHDPWFKTGMNPEEIVQFCKTWLEQ